MIITKEPIIERVLLTCECNSTEHLITFTYDDEWDEIYMHVHLVKRSFFKRLLYAIKYIFGYQCAFGAFDEIILNKEDNAGLTKVAIQLQNIYLRSKGVSV